MGRPSTIAFDAGMELMLMLPVVAEARRGGAGVAAAGVGVLGALLLQVTGRFAGAGCSDSSSGSLLGSSAGPRGIRSRVYVFTAIPSLNETSLT